MTGIDCLFSFFFPLLVLLLVRPFANLVNLYELVPIRSCDDRSTGRKTNCCFNCLRNHRSLWKGEFGFFSTVKNSNNRTVCYVVGVASSGKIWCFFLFYDSQASWGALFLLCFSPPFLKWVIFHYLAHGSIKLFEFLQYDAGPARNYWTII